MDGFVPRGIPCSQQTQTIMNESIPDNLKTDIQALADSLKSSLNGVLKSVVLYDGMAKNEYVKETDHVCLMIVLTEITTANLDKVGNALRASKRARQFQPLVLSENDLKTSTDVFPIKFLDMQQDYDVVAGEDVVKDLKISRDNLRLRCEQEIKNLMLRLRGLYISSGDNSQALESAMLRGYYGFLKSADALAELKTKKVYRSEEEVVAAIGEIGLDADLMQQVAGLRQGGSLGDSEAIKRAFEKFMAMVEKAAQMADEL